MEVVVLQVFVSLLLVVGSVILFGVSSRLRDYEHSDRLALMPLDDNSSCASKVRIDAIRQRQPSDAIIKLVTTKKTVM